MTNKNNKLAYNPDWQTEYSEMITTPEESVSYIRPGQRVFVGTGCGQPQVLVKALVARRKALVDTEIVDFLSLGGAPYAGKEFAEHFRVNSFFISSDVRDAIHAGMGDYTPILLSDIPALFSSGQLPLDAALIQVSPPNERGMCSLGIAVDIVKSAAENASMVIAQVNPQMPYTRGDTQIHVHDMDVLVPVDEPLIEYPPIVIDEETAKIGEYVAALIESGSTIEFGIGRIPQAVAMFLKTKENLGIHTEMFTDAVLDLIESGVVNGAHKSSDRNKVVASFCMGTKRLYDYVNDNPDFSFAPTEYVNDSFVISKQHKQVAINLALEVDLTGQVCADSLGTKFYSGIGGQVDFNRGASKSHRGKAIIALPSTAKNGTISRIKANLTTGAGVVTTRGDVQYIVTEYGVAYLHGKSIHERAIALISIAHPKFREELLKGAIASGYVRQELADVSGKMVLVPNDFKTTFLVDDGTQVNFRSMQPTDEPLVKDLFYALSQETIYYRFMSRMNTIPTKQIQDFVYVNHRTDIAIVATLPEAYGDEIIAIGRYYLDEKTNFAEIAFVVRDDWQNKGIGTFLLKHLATIAKRNGISGFTAEVLRANVAMQYVFGRSAFKTKSTPKDDVISFRIELK